MAKKKPTDLSELKPTELPDDKLETYRRVAVETGQVELAKTFVAEKDNRPVPVVNQATLPEILKGLSQLDLLLLANEYLHYPRRFLCEGTNPDNIHMPSDLPQVDPKKVEYDDLMEVAKALYPSFGKALTERGLEEMFLQRRLSANDLNSGGENLHIDKLETALVRLTSRIFPSPAHEAPQFWTVHTPTGEMEIELIDPWKEKRKDIHRTARDTFLEIEQGIVNSINQGDTDPSLFIPQHFSNQDAIFQIRPSQMGWQVDKDFELSAIRVRDIPEDHPLRKLAPFCPQFSEDGAPYILLGESSPWTIESKPKPYYLMCNIERLTTTGHVVWADKKQKALKAMFEGSETDEDWQKYSQFKKRKVKVVNLFEYPKLPKTPQLTSLAGRTLLALDILTRPTKYLQPPKPGTSLKDLLAMRRVFCKEEMDRPPYHIERAVIDWTGSWHSIHTRQEILESLFALGKSTFKAIEIIEAESKLHTIREYRKRVKV